MCLILTFETTHPYSSILAQPVPLLGPFPCPSIFCVCHWKHWGPAAPEATAEPKHGRNSIVLKWLRLHFIFENSSGSKAPSWEIWSLSRWSLPSFSATENRACQGRMASAVGLSVDFAAPCGTGGAAAPLGAVCSSQSLTWGG